MACAWELLFGAATRLAGTARAAAGEDVTLSQALFRRGLESMTAGNLAEACPILAESFRLDPLPGTLFTLAECEDKRGRVASALSRYEDYLDFFSRLNAADQARQRTRPKIAEAKRAALLPRVPRLTLRLSPSNVRDAIIYRDDTRLGDAALGVSLPIDPGAHTVRAEMDGRTVSSRTVTVAEGQSLELTLEVPGPDAPIAPAGATAGTSAPVPAPQPTGAELGAPSAEQPLRETSGSAQLPSRPGTPMPEAARTVTETRSGSHWRKPMAWSGAALMLGGALTYAVAWSKSRQITEAARSGKPYPEGAGNYRTWELTAAGLGVAGVGLLGTALWMMLSEGRSSPSDVGDGDRTSTLSSPRPSLVIRPAAAQGWTAGVSLAF